MYDKHLYYVGGGLVIGIFYAWFNEYNSPTVYGMNLRTMLMTACSMVAFLLVYFEKGKLLKIALLISAGVCIAVVLRIAYDGLFVDKTMHNLAPFEVLIAGALSLITALIGGGMALLARSASGRAKGPGSN
jgi:hypothetical protein